MGRARCAAALVATGLLGIGYLGGPAVATPDTRPATGRWSSIQDELDATVAAGVPGVVLLVRDGERTRVLTSGVADEARDTPIRADDHFRIASISKTFVAVAVLRLVERGLLRLDSRVDDWVPGLLPDATITIRQLLQHTSGLFDYADDESWWSQVMADPTRRWTAPEVISVATGHDPYFAPGKSWHYSNTGYAALGLVLQAATGRTPAQVVTKEVIRPLHLAHTYVASMPTLRPPFAHGYSDRGDGDVDVTLMSPTLAVTSGDVISTVGDVARTLRVVLDSHFLPAGLLAQMEDFVLTGDGEGYGYGLGLMTNPTSCGITYGHTGGIIGFNSDARESPDGSVESVIFVSTDSIPENAFPHFQRIVDLTFCPRGEPQRGVPVSK